MVFKRWQGMNPGDKITLEDNRRNWRIYNMPVELINWYISYAKLYTENQVWKVLELGKEAIESQKDEWQKSIEERLAVIERKLNLLEEGEEEVRTFGGKQNE